MMNFIFLIWVYRQSVYLLPRHISMPCIFPLTFCLFSYFRTDQMPRHLYWLIIFIYTTSSAVISVSATLILYFSLTYFTIGVSIHTQAGRWGCPLFAPTPIYFIRLLLHAATLPCRYRMCRASCRSFDHYLWHGHIMPRWRTSPLASREISLSILSTADC